MKGEQRSSQKAMTTQVVEEQKTRNIEQWIF